MRQRTILVVNSLTQLLSRAVTIGTRFFILPFAIAVLGRTYYGVWIIVGQIFAYTRILEAGLRGAIVRQVSVGEARHDPDTIDRHVNSAHGYFAIVGLAIMLLAAALCIPFPSWFHVEPPYVAAARIMVLCAGATLALTVMQYAYTAVLSGMQREDFMSATQLGADLLMLILIFALLNRFEIGGALIAMALISGGCTLGSALLRSWYAVRLCPSLKYRPWRIEWPLVRDMAVFGVSTVVYMMAVMVAAQLAQIVIGALVSPALATDFRVAMELITGVHTFAIAATISVKAAAGRYQGLDDHDMLRLLMLRSTRYASVVIFAGLFGLALFADPFLQLWQGRNYPAPEGAAQLAAIADTVRILAIGFGTFWLLLPAYNVLNGMGRHRFPAGLALISGVLSMLVVVVVAWSGATSIESYAYAVVAPVIPTYGLAMVVYACRDLNQPITRFLHQGFLIPLLSLLPAVGVGWFLVSHHPASNWSALLSHITICWFLTVLMILLVVLTPDDRKHFLSGLTRRKPQPPLDPDSPLP